MADADEIEKLLQQAGLTGGAPEKPLAARPPHAPQELQPVQPQVRQPVRPQAPPRPAQPAAQVRAVATMAPAKTAPGNPPALPAFDSAATQTDAKHDIGIIENVNVRVQVLLGRAKLSVEEILKLGNGSVVELDRLAGEPLDILVNDKLVARGEVLVLNDNFCVRVTEIVNPEA